MDKNVFAVQLYQLSGPDSLVASTKGHRADTSHLRKPFSVQRSFFPSMAKNHVLHYAVKLFLPKFVEYDILK